MTKEMKLMYEWQQNKSGEYSYVEAKKKRKMPAALVSAIVATLVAALMLTAFVIVFLRNPKNTVVNHTINGNLSPIVSDDSSGFRGMGEKLYDSVVLIPQQATDDFFYRSMTVSGGSGVIVSEDGYILTTCSAISGSSELYIYLSDGTRYEAALVGADRSNDCAVLKIDKTGLTPVEFADSNSLESGITVAAIGRILNEQLGTTLTLGTLNGMADGVKLTDGSTISLLQTTAATDNSNGSILVDNSGKVVGMITSTYTSGVRGIHFAIPSNSITMFLETVTNVSASGLVIGITGTDSGSGVVVDSVREGSAAEKSGILKGDLILKADGKPVKTVSELNKIRDSHQMGDTMTLSIYRDGEALEITIKFE